MTEPRVDYLVGGLRISLSPTNTSPGPRTHILKFTEALRDLGYKVTIVQASAMPFMGRFSTMNSKAIAQSSSAKLVVGDLVRIASALWTGTITFLRTVGRPRPAFIYERASVMQSLSSFHACKLFVPRVVEVNGILSRETVRDRKAMKLEGLARAIERHVFRRATLLVAVSENLKQEIIAFAGVPAERIIVVPNGIDERLAERAVALTPDGTSIIGFVGALSGWQRLDLLVEAAAQLPAHARIEIIGDGLERANLEAQVVELGLSDRVTLLGRMTQSDAFDRMLSWQIGFAGHEKSTSSVMYHSPLKIYEYAALGLDLVASESADARALAQSGLRVEFYGDDRALGDALAAALALPRLSPEQLASKRASLVADHGWKERVGLVLASVNR